MADAPQVTCYQPGSFEPANHFYPRARNAQVHPLVKYLFGLGNERIADRFCHLHPEVDPEAARRALTAVPRYFRWGGSDLLHVASERGVRRMVVIETNSCPSGQKSMPLLDETREQGGYRTLLEKTFVPLLRRRNLPGGALAVLYDKNEMETSGYASVLAELTGEPVYLVPIFRQDQDRPARFTHDGVLEVRIAGSWQPIRAALRYVTQRPWDRIPAVTRTVLLNPVLVCLAGGRNKMLASKAYDFFNAELRQSGMKIHIPETIWDVSRTEIPLWISRMGGVGVVKNPYSNAGQGVYTITREAELDAFMKSEQHYDRFIVQALIGNLGWSSAGRGGRLYHVGTVPNRKGHIYVADLRCMVGVSPEGFYPVAMYARRAREPLASELAGSSASSWAMLGTNLSYELTDGTFGTDSERLRLMDQRDFNQLGLGLDDLIEAYLQTVLAVTAIDRMADQLTTKRGKFRRRLFATVNPDATLVGEICA